MGRHSVTPATNGPEQIADEIVAQQFKLVDDQGKVRIHLRMQGDQPMIDLNDASGQPRITIFHQDEATGMHVKDAAGDTRIGLAQFPQGGGIAMHGEKGGGAAVYVLMNERARLDVYNRDGELTHRWPDE